MLNTCSFVLPNGNRCRCVAGRNSTACRHHTPDALRRRTAPPAPGAREYSEPTAGQISAHWRTYGAAIAESEKEDLPDMVEDLLCALGDRAICHRSAGRLFAAIEDRRRQLSNQAAQRRVMELAQAFEAQAPGTLPQGLSELLPFQTPPATGPRGKNATQ